MDLKQYIRECVQETLERQTVKKIIREELRRMYNEGMFEGGEPEDKKETDKGRAHGTALGQLNNILDKNPIIKKSQIAYKLHPGVDHDSARHIFQDQLEGEDPISNKDVNKAIDFIHNANV